MNDPGVNDPRTVAVVTGTRAEFGLLEPVMRAIDQHPALELRVLVTGTHLLPPARTVDEVAARFDVAETIEMQRPGASGRVADAEALGRGVSGFAASFARSTPDIVLVLGDRIEAFAAAAAASVAGCHLAHIHGGDRAEGIADEALRHAITRLAHVHLTATAASTERVVAMGEDERRTHCVGSPAIDGLDDLTPADDDAYAALGRPEIVYLLHPTDGPPERESERATALLDRCRRVGRVLALHPNHDPGREAIVAAIEAARDAGVVTRPHLDRASFVGVLRRAGVLVGNSSTGLIECAAIPLRAVDVGSRQSGRERPANVTRCDEWDLDAIEDAIREAVATPANGIGHPYGDGRSGARIAEVLATVDSDNHPLTKLNAF